MCVCEEVQCKKKKKKKMPEEVQCKKKKKKSDAGDAVCKMCRLLGEECKSTIELSVSHHKLYSGRIHPCIHNE